MIDNSFEVLDKNLIVFIIKIEVIEMEYTTLGNTDIKVSKICLGCMSFGEAGTLHDWTLDEKQT